MMKRPFAFLAMLLLVATTPVSVSAQESLADRIGHTDPSRYRASRSHGSVGDMHCMTLLSNRALTTNLQFLHRCQVSRQGGGVGHHFHNASEEMFVIFDGEAEFTIDGRTSLLQGTVGAPVRMGHSHAIYNPGPDPVEFVNINVTAVKGQYDAFDLDDPRVGVAKDEIPVFMAMRLDRERLRATPGYRGGDGTARYRRALEPTVFLTNWAYMDHLLLPEGASEGLHRHRGVEEVYYVISGTGEAQVGQETAPIGKGDAVPVRFGEAHAFSNTGADDLEFMIIGIALEKGILDTEILGGEP